MLFLSVWVKGSSAGAFPRSGGPAARYADRQHPRGDVFGDHAARADDRIGRRWSRRGAPAHPQPIQTLLPMVIGLAYSSPALRCATSSGALRWRSSSLGGEHMVAEGDRARSPESPDCGWRKTPCRCGCCSRNPHKTAARSRYPPRRMPAACGAGAAAPPFGCCGVRL